MFLITECVQGTKMDPFPWVTPPLSIAYMCLITECVQGTKHNFGDINTNLWHSTIIAGKIKLVTLSAYTPFEPGNN